MKIYLAHSLTQAPDEFKTAMLGFREKLKTKYEVLEYFGLSGGTPQDVYRHDIECVKTCDMVLAEVSYPGLGLGYEIATALGLNKKVFAVANHQAQVSRLVLGITHPNYKFIRYSSLEDLLNLNFN